MSNSVTPAVSVIVPTHNRPDMLSQALESVARQTFRDYEVVVVNDAGMDVAALVEGFAQRMSIRLVTHARNKGVAAARNTGIAASRGKYLAHLDDDDYYLEHHLAALHAFLRHSECRVAYTDARRDILELHDGVYRTVAEDVPYSVDFSRHRLFNGNITPTLCLMHDRDCLARAGLFAEYLQAHEDWDLWVRMARHYDFAHIPKVTCAFTARLDKTSLSSGNKDLMRDTWIFTRMQGMLAEQVPPVNRLEENARHVVRLGPDSPEPCRVSVVLPLAVVDAQTPRELAALCAGIGEAQLVLVGSGLAQAELEPLYRVLADALPCPPLALCHAGEIGRIFAANQGAVAATGEWLVFLEEDVRPQPGCLEALLHAAAAQPDCGALGGVVHSPGLVPLAGGRLEADGTPVFIQTAMDTAAAFQQVPLLSGHCLMLRRETFAALNGFDPIFAPAHYADADLCLRMAQQNRICGIVPSATLIWNKDARRLVQTPAGVLSRRIFQDRWAQSARTDAPDTAGADWSLRARPWPSDGQMPNGFTLEVPAQLMR